MFRRALGVREYASTALRCAKAQVKPSARVISNPNHESIPTTAHTVYEFSGRVVATCLPLPHEARPEQHYATIQFSLGTGNGNSESPEPQSRATENAESKTSANFKVDPRTSVSVGDVYCLTGSRWTFDSRGEGDECWKEDESLRSQRKKKSTKSQAKGGTRPRKSPKKGGLDTGEPQILEEEPDSVAGQIPPSL